MSRLVLIDGNSIMNRAFYGIMGSKMLTTKDGKFTNAVYGFAAIGGETSIGRGMFTVGYERDGKTEDVLLDGEVWEWRL